MNVNDFEYELLQAGIHEKVYFRHVPYGNAHIINKIEQEGDVIYLEESLDLECDYDEIDCQTLAVKLGEKEKVGQTRWDDNINVCFVYTEEKGYTKVICDEIEVPFIKKDNKVYIDVS